MSNFAIADMRRELFRVVSDVSGAPSPCSLVGYPYYGNTGDHVLWTAQCTLLRSMGMRIAYTASARHYDGRLLRLRCPDGPIFLTAGGNLGDVWPQEQALRERVLRDFPDRRIIQLPQSASFVDASHAARFGDLVRSHPNVTLLLRDEPSRQRLMEGCGLDSTLCPDIAYAHEFVSAMPSTAMPVLWLLRADKESTHAVATPDSCDWNEHRSWKSLLLKGIAATPSSIERNMEWARNALSDRFVKSGIGLLSSARVIVTDRLHGGIVSSLLGIPHVMLDNSYGKVHGFYRTWFDGAPDKLLATSIDEARSMSERLVSKFN